ncbi:MAG: hypothetical protein ACLTXT_03745 [Ruminococcus callidus]
MRPAVSHKNGTFQAGRTCRIRARGHRKIKAVFPHPGGFSAYMFLHCRAGRNLHSNYTLKLAKCKERYAFFSRIVQNIDFIFRVFHKKSSSKFRKAAARSAPELTSAGAETLFHNLFLLHSQLWKTLPAKPAHRFPQCGKCIAARFGADFHKAVRLVFHFAESSAAAVNAFQTEKQAEHPGEG